MHDAYEDGPRPRDGFQVSGYTKWVATSRSGDGEDLRQIAVSPDRLADLADRHGTVNDQVAPGRFGGAVNVALLEHMHAVASSILTDQQLRVWVLWLAGHDTNAIAAALEVSHQRVSQILHGAPRRKELGVVEKMKTALQADPKFMGQARKQLEDEHDHTERTLAVWWIASIGRPELFIPLTVLLLAHQTADAKRRVRFDYLITLMPRVAVEQGVHALRARGFIMYDGITVEIRKTPLDPQEVAA